jgi:hypothetical protein
MADESPSTKDLLFLITGLAKIKEAPATAQIGRDYWLTEPTRNDGRKLRESYANIPWLLNPKLAWDSVRFRDWLIATLVQNLADNKNEFSAISEPLIASIDVLGKEFTRDMKGVTPEIEQTLTTKGKRECSVFSTLTIGLSKHDNKGREVYVLGAGMRRRARVFMTESEDIQADVEFLVPFFELPNSEPKTGEFVGSSICAGVAITRSNGNPIGVDEDKNELFAIRFNLRIPFSSRWVQRTGDEYDLKTVFSDAEVRIEKRIRKNREDDLSAWQKFSGWKDFCKEFLSTAEGKDLMTAPIGPLIVGKVSDESGFTDIIIKQSKRKEIKEDLAVSKKEFDETVKFLGGIQNYKPPEKDKIDAPSSVRKLGALLVSLGVVSVKSDEYSVKLEDDNLTAWDVVNRILNELDGYPLYIKGVKPKSDKEARIALGLATVETEALKKFFGLGGVAYNIPLKVVSEKDSKKEKEDPETPTIVVSEDNFTEDTSILIEEDEQEESEGPPEEQPEPEPEKKGKQSTVEVFLHLGKWLSGETIDDNWLRRLMPLGENKKPIRVPVPGIRVMPIKRVHTENLKNQEATFSWSMLFDLVSLGVDIKGATKDGLTFIEGFVGHFGLGAVEVRLALKISLEDVKTEKNAFERVSIGVGVKLKDLRLSFAPREKKEEKSDELLEGLQELLKDDWAVVPAPTPTKEKTVRTRLSAKKKDKFSISVGYLTGLKPGSTGTLDIQLYDEKGNRGKMALIPIDRTALIVYVRQIGIGLKGVENLELSKGLPDSAQISVSITGGIRLPVFELGLIGAKFTFQLNNPLIFNFTLDGLDVSVKIGPVVISGSFFRSGFEFAGSLTVDFKKASFSAMGFYGNMLLFDMKRENDIVSDLNRLRVNATLSAKLKENGVTLRAENPVALALLPHRWEVYSNENEVYIVVDEDGDLTVLRPDKTFFVYAMLTADAGCGPTFGPIQFTGIAFGYGYNRKVKIPKIEDVAEFPLVQMVMGEGGYQDEDTSLDLRSQLGSPVEDPASVLADMGEVVVAAKGQQFACAGARFTIAGIVDCFALVIVQWGEEFEFSLLGLARFRHSRDLSARALCYIEMQILMSLKPKEGTFKLMGLLTSNSWIINTDCKLTGGFALCVWFDGDHKGDIVFTFGGYHPRFRRPEHYPVVPRLGLNWQIDDKLSFKGGIYLALTPSCGMVGGKLEATFHAGRISAWFTVYFDILLNWEPFYYDVEIGISLRVEAAFFLTSIKATLGASILMWGPPSGGIAHIDLVFFSFDVEFGVPRPTKLELLGSWEKFCHKFLNMSGGDLKSVNAPVKAFPIVQPNLAGGASGLNKLPNARREQQQVKPEDQMWRVRADEVEFAASTVVPVTSLNVGTVATNSPPQGVQDRKFSGQPMMAPEAVVLEKKGLRTQTAQALGVHPMGKTLVSVLNLTVVYDDGDVQPDLSDWTIELETGALPAALWDPAKPNLKPSEPSAKLMDKCIVGVKRLKPPRGKLGPQAPLPQITWQGLDKATVTKRAGLQEMPTKTRARDVQTVVVGKKAEQKAIVDALVTAGFTLNWEASQGFRELQAEPLAGAVA